MYTKNTLYQAKFVSLGNRVTGWVIKPYLGQMVQSGTVWEGVSDET